MLGKTTDYRVEDPYMNEYVFHCIVTAPPHLIDKLPPHLHRFTRSVSTAKRFVQKSSLEKKLQMLSALGGAFSLVLHPPRYLNKVKMEKVLKHFLEGRRLADVNEMIKEKVFVITDKDVMAVFAIMAQSCHSETYMLNKDYSLIVTEMVKKKFPDRKANDEDLKGLLEDHKLVCQFLLNCLMNQEYVNGMVGYRPTEIMLLLYLFVNKNKYVAENDLRRFFTSQVGRSGVMAAIRHLEQSLHIQKLPSVWSYTITGLGVQLISSYVNRVVAMTLK